ncbi:protein mono-ADP-ribosyltransferase PARP12-like isoform X1 [Macrobrachium nipponense]|uniref:protein mono-ADP-ribosyltransferase PARP12-like isoform X1 n=1 Tax=Macrobrachium nipponense TaxID=159736 RepID=UPI0030C87816
MNGYNNSSEDEDCGYYDPRAEKRHQRPQPGRRQRILKQNYPRGDYRAQHKQAYYNSDGESEHDFFLEGRRKDHNNIKVKERARTSKIQPEELAYTLSSFLGFRASLIELFEDHGLHPAMVRVIAEDNPQTFSINKHSIFLRPRISVCSYHLKTSGCPSMSKCDSFHICSDYLFRTCEDEYCSFGHRWQTKHNSNLLYKLHLHNLSVDILEELAKMDTQSKTCNYPLDICFNYNSRNCKFRNCKRLHLCLSFVTNAGKCTKTSCQLNHNIKAPFCQHLLKNHGIPTDETPRDTLHTLVSLNPKLRQLISRNKNPKANPKNINQNNQPAKANSDASPMPSNSQGKNLQHEFSHKSKSSWFNEVSGDVVLPEICFDSVEGICKNEMKGCPRLHAKSHFHWQVLGEDKIWYNFYEDLVMHLERRFCDPACDVISLHLSNTPTLDPLAKNILKLLGVDVWKADFESMTLHNISQNKKLKLRRLCTQKMSSQMTKENTYLWYFKDINQEWILYGGVDSTQNNKMKSSLSSVDIEEQFSKNPSASLKFSTNYFEYILDFTNMCQTNLQTNVSRKVCRRPYPHLLPAQRGNSFQAISASKSQWAHQQKGDVKIPEICFYSVESSCKFETTGCDRLHAKQHYCWQVCKNLGSWLNLQPEQAKCLELAFCDPNEDGVTVPVVDDSKSEFPNDALLDVMGRSTWTADFQLMKLRCSSLGETLQLRRLCSQIVPECSLKANEYHWYFKDINGKWILYGQYDSTKKPGMSSNITSRDIEKQFLENPFVKIHFHTECYKYVLDCSKMTQVNQNTKKCRDVRKRPKPHFKLSGELPSVPVHLPVHWEIMSPSEVLRVEKLSSSSSEYKKVAHLFQGSLPSEVKVVKVSRIQNPLLWKIFQKKVLSKEASSGQKTCQLFHGTSRDLLPKICYDNFDARTNGSPSRGIPFSQDAAGAYKHCKTTKKGHNYLIISSVLDNSIVRSNNLLGGFGVFLKRLHIGEWKTDVTEIYPQYIIKVTGNITKNQPC